MPETSRGGGGLLLKANLGAGLRSIHVTHGIRWRPYGAPTLPRLPMPPSYTLRSRSVFENARTLFLDCGQIFFLKWKMDDEPTSTIVLHRVRDGFGTMRDLEVFLDNEEKGPTPYGSETILHPKPGPHHLWVKMDWSRSESFAVDLREGQSIDLYCSSKFAESRIFGVPALILFPRKFFFIGAQPPADVPTLSADRKRIAQRNTLVITLLLMIPVLYLLRAMGMLVIHFSDSLGFVATPALIGFFLVCLTVVVGLPFACWKWFKKYLEENPGT